LISAFALASLNIFVFQLLFALLVCSLGQLGLFIEFATLAVLGTYMIYAKLSLFFLAAAGYLEFMKHISII